MMHRFIRNTITAASLSALLACSDPSSQSGSQDSNTSSRDHICQVITNRLPAEADNNIAKTLEAMPASAYLIDASGSMNDLFRPGLPKIDAVRRVSYPKHVDVYLFSENIFCAQAIPIEEVRAGGGTPLYCAVINVMEKMPYATLTVLTDGENTSHRCSLSDAIAAAKARGTVINVIGVDVESTDMERLATETGGIYKSIE